MSGYDDDGEVPAIRGWITKQGGSHKSWKKRWIQTTPRNPFRLDYYTNDSCGTLKGHIDMSGVTDMITTRSKDKEGNMRYGFQLVTDKRTWKLIVEGETDGEYFRESFRKLINQVRKSKGLPPLEKKKKKKKSKKHGDKKKGTDKKKKTPPSAPPAAPVPAKAGTGGIVSAAAPPPTRPSMLNKAPQVAAAAAPPPPPAIKAAAAPPPPPPPAEEENYEEEYNEEENYEEEAYDENYDEGAFEGGEEEEEYEEGEEEGDDIDESEYFDTEIRECEGDEKYAVALHQYDSTTDTELSIQRGQKLIIFDDSDPDGWLGAETIDGTRGWVSAHFVKML